MNDWVIMVVDTLRIKGKPPGWMPSAENLIKAGVPVTVAQRWKRERRVMTVGLRKRVRENRN